VDIVVCVKTNPDLQMVRFRNREPVLEAVPYRVGDLEKNALEAAVQLRDAAGGKVIALAVAESDRKIKETLKEALAIGADEAVIVADPALEGTDQAGIALALAKALEKIGSYVEYFGFYPNDLGTDCAHYVNGGLTYLLTDNVQFDIRLGHGLNNEADDLFTGVGLSVRF